MLSFHFLYCFLCYAKKRDSPSGALLGHPGSSAAGVRARRVSCAAGGPCASGQRSVGCRRARPARGRPCRGAAPSGVSPSPSAGSPSPSVGSPPPGSCSATRGGRPSWGLGSAPPRAPAASPLPAGLYRSGVPVPPVLHVRCGSCLPSEHRRIRGAMERVSWWY